MEVPITVIPQSTVICDGCGYPMDVDGKYVKGTDGINLYCKTLQCEYAYKLVWLPFERYAAKSREMKEKPYWFDDLKAKA